MKKEFFVCTALATFFAFSARAEDMVKVVGSACEIFSSNQFKPSIRVRVTDKASYNAVSQIPSLAELRSQLLEHDYNVIVYNLVDNYVQNMSVKTTSQDENELCVEVTGYIPAEDIVTVIANYSPSNPAPEYDFKKANGIVEEKHRTIKESKPTEAAVMYDGKKDFDKISTPSKAPIAYAPESSEEPKIKVEKKPDTQKEEKIVYQPDTPSAVAVEKTKTEEPAKEDVKSDNKDEVYIVPENAKFPEPVIEEPAKALVYIAPVEFSNNTHSSKPIDVLKEFFGNEDNYTLLNNIDGADYTITSKVLKAKIDKLNAKTNRMQMVVSTTLKINGADGSIVDHQNRFVLFESGENEQEVAMNLLRKLLQKSGQKIIERIEQNEVNRKNRPFLMPAKISGGL